MTFSEVLAHNRNLKRRRIRHRTTKEPPLTHTEEVRKLIGTQMEAMEQYLAKKTLSQFGKGEIVWDKNKPSNSKMIFEENNDKTCKVYDTNYKKTQNIIHFRSRSRSRHRHKKSHNKSKHRNS